MEVPPPILPRPWNKARRTRMIRMLSVISPPVARFPLIECVLSIHGGVLGMVGKRKQG